ncbi:hypothetical protein [Olleya sp. HaHaR_3_96]|uniref:hypothetical protein n=1 Tax=Olleya sp. HaHaR_3_96 TaxID=2745560 RepID=UPI001C4E50BF|nr:hypothetical protein [Olleya sp. HaHaR_3_96]QXP59320.1 hypothetical protein H0I26_15550 [Olleya sp. HaHaR_3_96]
MEKYLLNNIFSSEIIFISNETLPYKYIEELNNKKDTLINNRMAVWRNFITAKEDLYDLLISYRVQREITKYDLGHKDEDYDNSNIVIQWIRDALATSNSGYTQTTELKVSIQLRKFLYNKSEFYFGLKLLYNGLSAATEKDKWLFSAKSTLNNFEGIDVLELVYIISDDTFKKLQMSSEFLFISKTVINEMTGEYWPSQLGSDRYHAYKFSTIRLNDVMLNMPIIDEFKNLYGKDVRIGNTSEIFNPST